MVRVEKSSLECFMQILFRSLKGQFDAMQTAKQAIEFKDLPNDVRSAFRGLGSKVELSANTSLYRFTSHPGISPWWSETKHLAEVLLSTKASGKGLPKHIRSSTAVLRRWDSGMSYLTIGILKRPVHAFRGIIAPQDESTIYRNASDLSNYKKRYTKSVFFGGGNGQVYIPQVKSTDLSILVPIGTINIYDDVDDILDFLESYKLV